MLSVFVLSVHRDASHWVRQLYLVMFNMTYCNSFTPREGTTLILSPAYTRWSKFFRCSLLSVIFIDTGLELPISFSIQHDSEYMFVKIIFIKFYAVANSLMIKLVYECISIKYCTKLKEVLFGHKLNYYRQGKKFKSSNL